MKLTIYDNAGAQAGTQELPVQFSEAIRPDLITRAVLAIQAAGRQPYGGYGNAGMRHSAKLSRRRHDYRGSYGKGISRVPRKIHSRRGTQMSWVGALAPGTVGGRRAHPPKPYKDWDQKINTTENRKAIRSALAATVQVDLVTGRGHKIPKGFPFLINDAFEKLGKTTDVETALLKIGFAEEMARAGVTRVRAGKGKMRNRKYKSPTSILFVTSETNTPLFRSARNLPGVDVVSIDKINAELLAPGAQPGRLVLYTQAAIKRVADEGLFLQSRSAKPAKAAKPVEDAPAVKKAPAKKKPAKKAAKVAA